MSLERQLINLYTLGHNEVEPKLDFLTWDSGIHTMEWYSILSNEKVRFDIRGLAARLYTQSLYPKCDAITFPRIQVEFEPELDTLIDLVKDGIGLITLGIIEGLDRVSDFETLSKLRPFVIGYPDERQRLNEILKELL